MRVMLIGDKAIALGDSLRIKHQFCGNSAKSYLAQRQRAPWPIINLTYYGEHRFLSNMHAFLIFVHNFVDIKASLSYSASILICNNINNEPKEN
jgi:hypothetical protein